MSPLTRSALGVEYLEVLAGVLPEPWLSVGRQPWLEAVQLQHRAERAGRPAAAGSAPRCRRRSLSSLAVRHRGVAVRTVEASEAVFAEVLVAELKQRPSSHACLAGLATRLRVFSATRAAGSARALWQANSRA